MEEKLFAAQQLLESVASALAARRAHAFERVRRVEQSLENYRRALEVRITREFAQEHGFKLPAPAAISLERAAEAVLVEVQALPELAEQKRPTPVPTTGESAKQPFAPGPPSAATVGYPHLLARVAHGKVVVIGALSGRDRSAGLPDALGDEVEWIDTERDGAHAVGNLPQRVRQGRVAAIIILDRVVQHKHTDPVLAAARESKVPFAFAGQGGKASLLRALEQVEGTLAQSAGATHG